MSAEAERPSQRGIRINFNTVLAAACVLFSIFLFAVIPSEVERPPVLFGQQSNGLDPAFFPHLVATCFLIVGLWYLRASFSLNDVNGFRGLKRGNYVSVGFTMLMFVVYAAILQPLGFVLSSALVVALLSIFYGARHWLTILLVALGVPAAVYVVFRRLLTVALPELPDF
ncbi:MAG: tripartite tricarboxylate transporter TctB family protein [Pseudolabrys sp.]